MPSSESFGTIPSIESSHEQNALDSVPDAPVTKTFRYRLVKRWLDLIISFLTLLILSPFLLLVGILIRLTSPGPAIYAWDEVGRNGRLFRCYKFRTMVDNADAQKEQLLEQNEMDGPVFKIGNDPRITPLGRFLRKFSIDEIPQMACVLKGDMSLVGPRPARQDEWEQYETWQRRRMSVTPGISGIWQTQGRNSINNFERWTRLDLEYIDTWSLGLDLRIMARTILVILAGTGT